MKSCVTLKGKLPRLRTRRVIILGGRVIIPGGHSSGLSRRVALELTLLLMAATVRTVMSSRGNTVLLL